MIEFNFPPNIQDLGYKVFPDAIENDSTLYFHGTSETAFENIKKEGFRPGPILRSISFINASPLALRYACTKRSASTPNGVIIIVRFPEGETRGMRRENSFLYLDDLTQQPEIVGFCLIPSTYRFV